jgi:hypothetical protein
MRKHVYAVAGVFVAMGLLWMGYAACTTLTTGPNCPSLTPTTPGVCPDCPTYYTYTASPTWVQGPAPGPCKNPHATTFSVGSTAWVVFLDTCPDDGICNYAAFPGSVSCGTTTCDDYGC